MNFFLVTPSVDFFADLTQPLALQLHTFLLHLVRVGLVLDHLGSSLLRDLDLAEGLLFLGLEDGNAGVQLLDVALTLVPHLSGDGDGAGA